MKKKSSADQQSTKFIEIAKAKSTWIFDMDGVLYRGRNVVPGAPAAIALLRRLGKKVLFLTNNSTRTRDMYVDLLRGMGITATIGEIFTSASILASWLETHVKSQGLDTGSVNLYVIGEDGIRIDLQQRGFAIKTDAEFDSDKSLHGKVQHVVVGLDRGLTYRKLDIAQNCIVRGAKFLATNDDAALPVEDGFLAPGAGAIIQALVTCTKRSPDFGSPFGKPNPAVFHEIGKATGVALADMISIGDRLETDILAAKQAGITSVLVFTGITTPGEPIPFKLSPDFTLKSIDDLNNLLG
nr:HAD-IIA family hydrolase [Candidatus Sigynarchaeota archaeon]